MIKVLQIGLGPNPGGIENCIMNYYRNINHSEYSFDFVDIYGKGLAYANEIAMLGGKIYSLTAYKNNPLKMAKELRGILVEGKFDIIHINMLSAANMIPVLISCMYGKADVVVHSHNSSIPKGWIRIILNAINIHILRMLPVEKWGCGDKAGKWMWGKSFEKENIIFNAVDQEKFQRNDAVRTNVRLSCGFKSNEKVIGFVGRLSEQKNPLFLIEIIKALSHKDKDIKLIVVGDGELRPNLEEKIQEYDLEDNVYLAGIQNNVCDWYQAMDGFVLPSLFEGLPVVGIEAQASGLPCFFSNRITEEVDVTKTVEYLSIDNGAEIWADAIIHRINELDKKYIMFPDDYKINYAAKELEKKYSRILCKR